MAWFTRGDRTTRRGELLESAVGVSTSLSGVIRSDGGVRIDGHFEGHIDVAGNVVVGESGVVQVDVLRARNITVGGTVTGNVECGGRLEILATGQVVGDIVADAIMIDQGGVFQGASRMRSAMPVLPPPVAQPPHLASGAAGGADASSGVDDVIIDLGPAPTVDRVDDPPASAPPETAPPAPPPVRRVASPAPERPPRADVQADVQADGPPRSASTSAPPATSSAPSAPRVESVLGFALDIEPIIPDTAAGSASGAAHQPQAAAAGADGARRTRRAGGNRRR
ncbi:MAG: polymer-forming cytoskeletal protein [Ardenticatenales bacterium]|nr:polymer-forming cytoskeletal protein [Ardenticatenales bacterium]